MNLDGGAIHCILSGSSSDLRELAFGKLPEEKRIRYANYTGRNLNSTKFSPRWIYPFCNRNEFVQAVELMKKRFTRNIDEDDDFFFEDEWNGIFIQTGGIGRLIEDFARGGGSTTYAYSASANDYLVNECTERRILLGIYRCVSLHSVGFKSSFDWMASVPVSALFESDDKETLYKMADHGLIRYYDNLNEIAFANPRIFGETEVHSRSKGSHHASEFR